MHSGFAKVLMFLAIVGALNWGLIGVFNWNLFDAIFGGGSHEQTSTLSRVIYTLVGISGLLALGPLFSREQRLPIGRTRPVMP